MYHFSNPSLLPLTAITTLGVSVKDGDDPIGRFGTGLKYTIAGALRLGQEISIETGGRKYYFHSVPEDVRGKTFNIVHMTELQKDGTEVDRALGFSTELGKHWDPWMYIRELWSNCRDEGGTYGEGPGESPTEEETRIIIAGDLFEDACANLDDFILNSTPLFTLAGLEIHGHLHDGNNNAVFYQKIRVFQIEGGQKTLYRYNILGKLDLSEDRTIASAYSALRRIAMAIIAAKDPGFIKRFLTIRTNSGFFEEGAMVYLDSFYDPSDTTFTEVLKELWDQSPMKLNDQAKSLAYRLFTPDRTTLDFELTAVERAKFNRALALIQKLGFNQPINWHFIEPDDQETYGFVENGEVYLTRQAFRNGTQFLAQTMIEEYIHKVHDLRDYSREFQDFLLARIVSLGEEWTGEAL